jgi:general secretion pathway protein G
MNRRKGFTFVEILMVMIIIGLLSSLGILKYIDLKRQAYAVKIASEIHAVQVGAFNYWAALSARLHLRWAGLHTGLG